MNTSSDPLYRYLSLVYKGYVKLPYDMSRVRFFYFGEAFGEEGAENWPLGCKLEKEHWNCASKCKMWLQRPTHEKVNMTVRSMHLLRMDRNWGVAFRTEHDLPMSYIKEDTSNAYWVEVIRFAVGVNDCHRGEEQLDGLGTWFFPVAGSGIWIKLGRSWSQKYDDDIFPLLQRWQQWNQITELNTSLDWRWARDGGCASPLTPHAMYPKHFRGKQRAVHVMAADLGYDTVIFDSDGRKPLQQLVVTSFSTMVRPDCYSNHSRAFNLVHCYYGPNTCGHNIELRTGLANERCMCDDSHLILNCLRSNSSAHSIPYRRAAFFSAHEVCAGS